jgi:hypothetical protein
MAEYNFIIQYSRGADMPGDFLSRNVLSAIYGLAENILALQHTDEFAQAVFLFCKTVPYHQMVGKRPTSKKLVLPQNQC